jgi:hypothetical protein
VGRASSRVNEGWGKPPIKGLMDLTTDGRIRATCNFAEGGKKGNVGTERGAGISDHRDRDRARRRRITFIFIYSCIWRRRVTFVPKFC